MPGGQCPKPPPFRMRLHSFVSGLVIAAVPLLVVTSLASAQDSGSDSSSSGASASSVHFSCPGTDAQINKCKGRPYTTMQYGGCTFVHCGDEKGPHMSQTESQKKKQNGAKVIECKKVNGTVTCSDGTTYGDQQSCASPLLPPPPPSPQAQMHEQGSNGSQSSKGPCADLEQQFKDAYLQASQNPASSDLQQKASSLRSQLTDCRNTHFVPAGLNASPACSVAPDPSNPGCYLKTCGNSPAQQICAHKPDDQSGDGQQCTVVVDGNCYEKVCGSDKQVVSKTCRSGSAAGQQ